MGDYGKTYATYTQEMCLEMKNLVSYANILTPNVTEACILTDTPYQEKFRLKDYERMARQLSSQGQGKLSSLELYRAALSQITVMKQALEQK